MRPLLLLPAGDFETLKQAVNNGADEIYLGVKQFNARATAKNFSFDELKEAIKYCHIRGVKVYVTLNILVKNKELNRFFDSLNNVYLANADGVIIQEVSFAKLIKKYFPDLEVHGSTQARINNLAAINNLKYLDRVILSRELSKIEVDYIAKNSKIPIEMFVHGALCFCYSGLCLMSSMIGGRSGNRGMCAQPCRKKYNGKYPLSMKDLCLIDEVKK